MTMLDYATGRVLRVRPILGRTAAWLGVVWTAGLVPWLVLSALEYFAWNQLACGTPAFRMHREFFAISPILLLVPAGCWVVTFTACFAERLARLSFLVSVTAWSITAAFIHWGWMLQ